MISRIGIIANLTKPRVRDAIIECLDGAKAVGLSVVVASDENGAEALGATAVPSAELASQVDAVVSLGGDGTFLRAARAVVGSAVPVLGINLGSLGFLAEVRREEIGPAMEWLAKGNFDVQRRCRVRVQVVREGETIFEETALNDIVLNMGEVPRAIDLEVRVAGTRLGRYLSDGLIVATPTGSTAYSLSAGGPIVDSDMQALLLTPICPHTLGVRPMILDERRAVEVRLIQCPGGNLTGDGQVSIPVHTGDRLTFVRASEDLAFLRLPERNLFEIIQEKLGWGGSRRSVDPPPAE